MRISKRPLYLICCWAIGSKAIYGVSMAKPGGPDPHEPQIPAMVQQFTADSSGRKPQMVARFPKSGRFQ